MKVKQFIKGAKSSSIIKIFKNDYNLNRKGLEERLDKFLKYIQTVEPITEDEGIIVVRKFYDEDNDEVNVHSNLIFPYKDKVDYAYFIDDWPKILDYEVVVEDGITKLEAQANIIFEMTYMGTTKRSRANRIKKMFDY